MDDLKSLVKKELEQAENSKVIGILQKINEKFLNEYHLDIGGFIIEPLVIEAYFHKDGVFCDGCVHAARNEKGKMVETARKRQRNNFGKLYIHNVKNKDDGLDVCLSDGDYYYSVLIKNAILNSEKFATQTQISVELCGKCNGCTDVDNCVYNETSVIKKNESKNLKVVHIPRKNVPNNVELASVSIEAIKEDINSPRLTLAAGFGKQWKASVVAIVESKDETKAKELADRLNGSKVETNAFEKAKSAYKN